MMMQPANKDKIELLGEWLRYSMRQNNCEHYDGRFADICSAFILHAIAFLEVVRQVCKKIPVRPLFNPQYLFVAHSIIVF